MKTWPYFLAKTLWTPQINFSLSKNRQSRTEITFALFRLAPKLTEFYLKVFYFNVFQGNYKAS